MRWRGGRRGTPGDGLTVPPPIHAASWALGGRGVHTELCRLWADNLLLQLLLPLWSSWRHPEAARVLGVERERAPFHQAEGWAGSEDGGESAAPRNPQGRGLELRGCALGSRCGVWELRGSRKAQG